MPVFVFRCVSWLIEKFTLENEVPCEDRSDPVDFERKQFAPVSKFLDRVEVVCVECDWFHIYLV